MSTVPCPTGVLVVSVAALLQSCLSAVGDAVEGAIATSAEPYRWNASPWAPDGTALLATDVRCRDVFRLEIGGGESRRIAEGPLAAASYSPDGETIVCASSDHPDAGTSLWTVAADGSDRMVIATAFEAGNLAPVWSPDGSWIAHHGAETLIELVRPDLSERRVLGRGAFPVWSPDGKHVASTTLDVADGRFTFWLYVLSLDGSPAVRIARGAFPSWSPDGCRLAFDLYQPADGAPFRGQFYVVDLPGGQPRPVADGSVPRWSPDGERILFWRRRDGASELVTIAPDGTDERVLVRPADWGHWSPDGSRVAFGRGSEFLVIDADGSNERSLGRIPPPVEP